MVVRSVDWSEGGEVDNRASQSQSLARQPEATPEGGASNSGGIDQPVNVLFVCTGNICRSAFGQVCLASRLSGGHGVRVASAGVMALVDHPLDELMRQQAARLGLDGSGHRARQLTGRILKDADIVLVFGAEHVDWISASYPEHLERVVALGQAAAVLRSQPRRALTRVSDLVRDVRQQRPDPLEEDWIADPYRQGTEAARMAAERIWGDVEVLARKIEWTG